MHKKLFSDFKSLASRLSYSDALNVIINSVLHPACIRAHQDFKIPDPIGFYKLTVKECEILKSILIEIGELMERGHEPLGDLFMEFVSKGNNGQYFTPMDICRFMQLLVFGDSQGENPKSENVHDPACGSGRMLLAAAVTNKSLHCYGTDVDDQCCRMAAANMILHNLIADITCGNELTLTYSHGYLIRREPIFKIPTLHIVKYVKDETAKSQPEKMILSTPKNEHDKLIQGSLF
ncbi:MAG: N-6 DNA methylase [Sphingobacterium sp.]|nr:N-6 DNA methylase [Sphingobacterium sp.]